MSYLAIFRSSKTCCADQGFTVQGLGPPTGNQRPILQPFTKCLAAFRGSGPSLRVEVLGLGLLKSLVSAQQHRLFKFGGLPHSSSALSGSLMPCGNTSHLPASFGGPYIMGFFRLRLGDLSLEGWSYAAFQGGQTPITLQPGT